ncbi:MAG: type II secretory pathway pseudopilin PulG [Rhodothermales bacterium]|jgi:type II secretory pathway pseudopilin PulG
MRKSFSMIEMLGVIIVIMILAGLLFPTISSIIDQGNKTKTKAKINGLKIAITSFKSTYGYLPFSSDTTPITEDTQLTAAQYTRLLRNLTATDTDMNPRAIRFLDKQDVSYKDAWDTTLKVALDLDYDGEVNGSVMTPYTTTIGSEIAIWSAGSDTKNASTDDNVVSWKD